jgi:GNAT superfamily N-acetyltransferase
MNEEISGNDPELGRAALAGRVTLRESEESDRQFLTSVYGTTRAAELALVPWSEEQRTAFVTMQYTAQAHHYQQNYPESRQLVIYLDDQPVGRLYINRGSEEIRILDITVLPSFGGRGIGDYLIGELQSEARSAGKPLTIYVESYNPTMRFFEKRGFAPMGQQGAHVLMGWRDDESAGP